MTMYNVLVNKQINLERVETSATTTTTTTTLNDAVNLLPPSLYKLLTNQENCDLFKKYNVPIPSQLNNTSSKSVSVVCVMRARVSKIRRIRSVRKRKEVKESTVATTVEEEEEEETYGGKVKDYNEIMTNHVIMIPKYNFFMLQHRIFPGSYFAFLMSHSLKNKKKDTNIGFSKNPIYSLYLHNGQHIVNKNTSSAAPYWILDTILGPFSTEKQAMCCCNEWVSKTRGRESKRLKAYSLYKKYGVNLYSHQVKLNEPYDQFLYNINAPLNYIKKTREILDK